AIMLSAAQDLSERRHGSTILGMTNVGHQLRLGVLVSGGGTTMQNLAEVIARGELDAEIVLCIASNATCFAIERATKLNIPTVVINRQAAGSLEAFSGQIAAALRAHRVDLALMAGFL